MKLYHGTTETVAKKVIFEGLKPRIMVGKSNWNHTVKSNPSLVYLTSVYAPFFSICSAKQNESLGIVEVDIEKLDPKWMRPDEDFIEQASRYAPNLVPNAGKGLINRTKYVKKHIDEFKHLWKESIKFIGNCAFKGQIPTSAITKIVVIERKYSTMEFNALNPSITIENFSFCQEQYKFLTKWFIGEPIELDDWLKANRLDKFVELDKDFNAQIPHLKDMLKDQSGIKRIY